MINPMTLEGKKILVTGASSGIGRETAILASNLGADVVILARRLDKLEETLLLMEPGNHKIIQFDLTDFDEYQNLFKKIIEDNKKLTGMVHCAGIAKTVPIQAISHKLMMQMMNVNYFSFVELIRYYVKNKYSDNGSIVGISAINAHRPRKCMSIYAGTKGALESTISTLALELHDKGIRINSVVPGAIDTEMSQSYLKDVDKDQDDSILKCQLMKIGESIDVANVIVFLLSDASKFVTGRHYYVDGGWL